MLKTMLISAGLILTGVGAPNLIPSDGDNHRRGEITLVSDTWDNMPKVEVAWGTNAWQNPVGRQTYTNVKKGWRLTRESRICYRRSRNPSDPTSTLNTWTCSSNPASRPHTFSLH